MRSKVNWKGRLDVGSTPTGSITEEKSYKEGDNVSFLTKNLAKEVLSKYPCAVEVAVNPNYYVLSDRGSICGLGLFQPHEVERLSNIIGEISNQIYLETGLYITDLDWLDIFPEDMSLLDARIKEANEGVDALLGSLQSGLIEESER